MRYDENLWLSGEKCEKLGSIENGSAGGIVLEEIQEMSRGRGRGRGIIQRLSGCRTLDRWKMTLIHAAHAQDMLWANFQLRAYPAFRTHSHSTRPFSTNKLRNIWGPGTTETDCWAVHCHQGSSHRAIFRFIMSMTSIK